MRRGIAVLCVTLCASAAWAAGPTADPIQFLKPRHWLEIPNSRMKAVAFEWPKGIRYSINNIGVRGVIALWSRG